MGKKKPVPVAPKLNIRKGDSVIVLSGKSRDRSRPREVIGVLPREGKVLVEGVNVVKDVQRASSAGQETGIVEKTMPINASNVALVDPKTGKATRIKLVVGADGKRQRVSVKSGEVIG